ncbi:aspartate 1-decarboxylase [Kroppenstedtia eburnea]|uniref:Aspartate 1-decarboxylase n=1 Tax=Kroppenstedtia eburnea TaxID=714067 RepID=A0A1N7PFW6_9BACL|nr:aspartate 1-decarboxylase [Kroppenstedtia eburnea]EGK11039.1 aspartate 1-decarboxylase [Desmospora sp. 8437]QKI83303.1 aspartate 1-decarboxylase [Kroppenstedtia eburnea]SIT09482.1 L-aspartate 1-decarboxylase [Kroppenstedtia eburnea]
MLRWMCKGKIHRATVTESDLNYEGSITIDARLMEEAGILPFEMVQVTSLQNATSWRTYAIPSEKEGTIGLNGPPARLFRPGDKVIILNTVVMEETEAERLVPKVVLVDESNRIVQVIRKELDPEGSLHGE